MNAPSDRRPTRSDLEQELRELLGEADATMVHRAGNADGHARMIEQSTRNLSVDVAKTMVQRSMRRRTLRPIYLIPTFAAAAVAAFVWLMPDDTQTGQPFVDRSRPVVSATSQVPAHMPSNAAPSAPITPPSDRTSRRAQVAATMSDQHDNTLKNKVLDDLASQNVVDRLARTSDAEALEVTSITDADIDHLLAGL